MTIYKRYLFTLLVLISIFTYGTQGICADSDNEYHNTFTVAANTPVMVKNTNGNIEISTWDKDYVDVSAEMRSRYGQDEIDLVSINVIVNDDMVIESVLTQREGGSLLDRLFGSMGRWPRVDVVFDIKLPRNLVLEEAATTNGTIKLKNTYGATTARTTNGKVEIDGHQGSVVARSTNGNIEVRGDVSIKRASTTNGRVDVTIARALTEPAEIETVNGSVNVQLPDNLNVDLDVRTVNGSINANGITMRIETVSKNRLVGVVGDGGPRLTVKTVNGSVDLEIP